MNDSTADKDNESVASQHKTEPADSASTTDPEDSTVPGRHSADSDPVTHDGDADTSSDPGAAVAGGSSAASPPTAELAQLPRDEDSERRAAERDKAVRAKPVLARIIQFVAAVFFPIIVMAGAVRVITTPAFLWLEYHRPGFPDDRFGFGLDERMTYGSYAMDYLLNFAPPQYLGGLVNAAGDPLFASGEVAHMTDVKTVIQLTFLAAVVLVVLEVAALIYLGRRYPGGIRRSLFAGSVITLLLIIAVAVLAALGWQQFFAAFHSIFFADGTWTFAASDTLIRLFPGQFWIDAGIAVAAVVLVISTLTLAFTWPTKPRRDRTRYRY